MKLENMIGGGGHSAIRTFLVIISMSLFLCGPSVDCLAYDVDLSWQANTETDVIGYKVYYAVDSEELPFAGVDLASGPSPVEANGQTSATISGLDPKRTYYFAVAAYNTNGIESVYSDVVASLPDLTPPSLTISTVATQTLLSSQTISGTVLDDFQVEAVSVKVNNRAPVTADIINNTWLSTMTDLTVGDNSIVVTATDIGGNSAQKNLSVTVYNAGPTNTNGILSITDALTVLQYVVGLKTPTTEELIRSDVSPIDVNTRQPKPNGSLDVSDALVMLRKVVGLSW